MFEFILLFIFFWWLFSRNEKRKERKRKLFKPSLDQELKELIQSEDNSTGIALSVKQYLLDVLDDEAHLSITEDKSVCQTGEDMTILYRQWWLSVTKNLELYFY